VNVLELSGRAREATEKRFFVSFGHFASWASEFFTGEVRIHFIEVFQRGVPCCLMFDVKAADVKLEVNMVGFLSFGLHNEVAMRKSPS
jgi:hypothetical protein